MGEEIKVFIITYKRPILLRRALQSLIEQSHQNWVAEVLNDDPNDLSVNQVIDGFKDKRIRLTSNLQNRGGTGNFNYAFKQNPKEEFACILEDDNWFEPNFMSEMLKNLKNYPNVQLAVANENIWLEKENGEWVEMNSTVWPEKNGNRLLNFNPEEKCLTAQLCNSSMLWKTGTSNWLTPEEIPIDVTEHFRERIVPHPILLVAKPLVNFAVTLKTNRKKKGEWSVFQALLIASVFENLNFKERVGLAQKLWIKARKENKFLGSTLMNASMVSAAPKILFHLSSYKEKIRYLLTIMKRPRTFIKCLTAKRTRSESWSFLISNWNIGNEN